MSFAARSGLTFHVELVLAPWTKVKVNFEQDSRRQRPLLTFLSGDGLDDDSEGFGYGAGTRLNPFFPWGAFAGTYQPGTGRSGSGCAGFGCGIQFGDFFPAFGQLFNNYDGGFSSEQQSPYYPGPGDFARMGGASNGPVGFPQIYFPPGSSSSSSSSSSSNNGNGVGYTNTYSNVNGISSRVASTRDSSGKVTTVQGGSGVPDTITTRVLRPGQSGGIYASSGVQVNPDGNASSYRKSGQY
ncbi:unnamed protein product [Allacma fusca]|uniref:Uncharacterized protein n=1 Tax=Allacma fusca TaxID=39272 RepID=A0A8J2KU23_9HEXA|nr:unnamed protein product [Allacma fusca]